MNELAITIAIILFPGVIALFLIERLLNYYPNWSSFRFLLNSFIAGVLCYIILQVVIFLIGLFPSPISFLPSLSGRLDIWDFATNTDINLDISEVFAALIIAPIFALLITRAANTGSWFGMKGFAASTKYGNENVFSFYLQGDDLSYYHVRDSDTNIVHQGIIVTFSETEIFQEILMENVTIFNGETGDIIEEVDSVYISKPLGAFIIEKPKKPEMSEENDGQAHNPL